MRTFLISLSAMCMALCVIDTGISAQPLDGDSKEGTLADLTKIIKEQSEQIRLLTERLNRLEKDREIQNGEIAPATSSDEPEIPPLEIPGQNNSDQKGRSKVSAPASASPAISKSAASLTPDISVIGTHIGRFFSPRGDPDRNRFQLGEFEIGLQQPVFTGIRFDAFLTGGADNNFTISAEEAYATFSKIGHLPFGGYLGLKRLDFGKVNPIHPHARPYADQPAPLAAFLGPDALSGNGAAINYLLPVKNLFANVEIGLWNTAPADQSISFPARSSSAIYPVGLGVKGNFPMARLWLSKELPGRSELELGSSYGFGRAEIGDPINLFGFDMTYHRTLGAFSKLIVQGEYFLHHRIDNFGETGGHSRSGGYGLISYSPDQYMDYGFRYDSTTYPWPIPGRENSLSLIWTNHLTEVTLLRLQYKHGDRTNSLFLPPQKGYNELLLEFLWGAGSHTHPLQ